MAAIKRMLLPLLLLLMLLFAACGDKQKEVALSTPAPEVAARDYKSEENGLSFSYPVGWTIQESGSVITITSVAGLDCGGLISDITHEVELFLAGHGDLSASVEALMQKHALLFTGGSPLNGYTPKVNIAQDGSIAGAAVFSYEDEGKTYEAQLAISQFGGRVLLDLFGREQGAQKADEMDAMYQSIILSLQLSGTEGTLAPADLSVLGFPDAPEGCYSYYNPITGQFLTIPCELDVISEPYEEKVVLYSGDYGLMVTENWTDRFNEVYASTGDLKQCYAEFLSECLEVVETVFGQKVVYRDFKYQSGGNNGELVRAAFYIDPDGTPIRCFAEIAARGSDDQYAQGTLVIYSAVNETAGRALFNSAMGNSAIEFPLR